MARGESIHDVELVVRALRGSEQAFRELVLRYQKPVFSVIVRMVRDPQTAEDLAQETFLKAFRALQSYDQRRKFSSWLFKIAHNSAIDFLRRTHPETEPLVRDDEERPDPAELLEDERARSPQQDAVRSDLRRDLDGCLNRLRPEYREVMQLRFGEGLSYQEIAEIMETPLGTVKTNLHRARKEMARLMAELGWEDEA